MVAQFVQMIEKLKKCEKAGATTACLMQIYVYIDTLAYFGMPSSKEKNSKSDFIEWADKYLKAEKEQNYQYRGKDLYGARCALLHTFSSEGNYHIENQDIIRFGYHDGGRHYYDPKVDDTLVIIGVASFVNDFVTAVTNFLQDIKKRIADENEKSILEERLKKILNIVPFPTEEQCPRV